jgi:hypothetical protein
MAYSPLAYTVGIHSTRRAVHSELASGLARPACNIVSISHAPIAGTLSANACCRALHSHGSYVTSTVHGTPSLAGIAYTTPPHPAVGLQRTSPYLHDSPFGHSSTLPNQTYLSVMNSSTLGLSRGTVFQKQQLQPLQPPAWIHTSSTAGVLEYSRPEQLVPTYYLVNHGFTWVDTAESDAVHKATAYLHALGFLLAK